MSLVLKTANVLAMASGIQTTVAASDTIDTGLREVLYTSASMNSDPVLAVAWCSVTIPDQIANPGKITIKTWKATGTGDATPTAATTFSKLVNWVAFGR